MPAATLLPARFRRGTTARLFAALVCNGEFFFPKYALPTVSIYDPNGIRVVAEAPASAVDLVARPSSPFNYFFDFQIPPDAAEGVYEATWTYLDGGLPHGSRLTPTLIVDPPLN